jgi:hypothetical protein
MAAIVNTRHSTIRIEQRRSLGARKILIWKMCGLLFGNYSLKWTLLDGLRTVKLSTSDTIQSEAICCTRWTTTPAQRAVQNVDVRSISWKEDTFNTYEDESTAKAGT